MVGRKIYVGFWWGNLQAREHLEEEDADGTVILQWTRKKQNGNAWTGFICLNVGRLVGFCDHCNET
jgi:hypothetical protein